MRQDGLSEKKQGGEAMGVKKPLMGAFEVWPKKKFTSE